MSDPTGMPEIDFGTFVMSLASSVLVHLGEIEHPESRAREPDLPLAKQTVDLLGHPLPPGFPGAKTTETGPEEPVSSSG